VPVAAGVVVAVILLALGMRNFYSIMALALSTFVTVTIGHEFWRGIGARHRLHGESYPVAFARLVGRNRRRYGGYIVHLGIVLYFVAFTGQAFKADVEASLQPGESVDMRSPWGYTYTFTHLGVSQYNELNRFTTVATVEVARDGERVGIMSSEKRQHVDSFGSPTFEPSTEAGIRSDLREDIYIVYAGSVAGTEEAVYRFTLNPLVWWLWFGGAVLVLGGVVTLWPGAATTAERRRAMAGYAASITGKEDAAVAG
jgi:cytochrome c-type biogenesis protein CcmF